MSNQLVRLDSENSCFYETGKLHELLSYANQEIKYLILDTLLRNI